jgi:hypothetical protein
MPGNVTFATDSSDLRIARVVMPITRLSPSAVQGRWPPTSRARA